MSHSEVIKQMALAYRFSFSLIDIKYRNTVSEDRRQEVDVTLNGMTYYGLVSFKGQNMNVYIPEIDKTLEYKWK